MLAFHERADHVRVERHAWQGAADAVSTLFDSTRRAARRTRSRPARRRAVVASGDAAVALGMARARAWRPFAELAGAKTPHPRQALLRDQPMVPLNVGPVGGLKF
ncbi:MAG: hypothetical protein DMD96_34125 [Candidatus Rokuibacteriota bacterium]|nr:MAG: hypothetical protein DMD96_34125 [Candidatus Rokubacteria bacterium]